MDSIKGYSFDIITNTLKITEKFEKRAGMVDTPEYQALLQLRKDYPDLKIERLTANKGKHKDLKISVMLKKINDKITENPNQKTINGRLVKEELAEITELYKGTKGYAGKVKKLYFDTYPKEASPQTNKNKAKKIIKNRKEMTESLKELEEAIIDETETENGDDDTDGIN